MTILVKHGVALPPLPPLPEALTSTTLSVLAYEHIRDALVLLDLAPGEPVNEERLAAELGMGRTPVREALKRLEAERLVVAFPRRGTYAAEINVTDLEQIFEVRRLLEPLAAHRAADRATGPQRAQLLDLHGEIEERAYAGEAFRRLMTVDLRVHRALYGATGNRFLEQTLVQYDNHATRIWGSLATRLTGVSEHIDHHAGLLRAVVAGDATTAERLAAEHVDTFETAVRHVL